MEQKLTLRELTNTKGKIVSHDLIEQFRTAFRGELIRPDDLDYETARKIWNASIDRRPGLIAHCSGAADVIAAVNFARENELLVAVRGGGHNVSGRALCDDGIVIDLSGMKGIFVDAKSRIARVQGGATLGDLDRETHVFGSAVPAALTSELMLARANLGTTVSGMIAGFRPIGRKCEKNARPHCPIKSRSPDHDFGGDDLVSTRPSRDGGTNERQTARIYV